MYFVGYTRGYGVYGIMRDLIMEGKDAELVGTSGCYRVNWDRALERYADYKRKKNRDPDSKDQSRRKLSNCLRSALLTKSYKEDGAKEYSTLIGKRNDDGEIVERQFQMPRKVFKFFFGNAELSDNSEEQDEQVKKRHLSKGQLTDSTRR